ncbi:Dehydrin [Musa troglodytarum]|uniref:Dehydrin n=1 Tax=Musa troglodytarum TaxID=320322 RepID=A0A9E7EJ69_9LILI|nr:Dehydrin [Musa troglodytarum]
MAEEHNKAVESGEEVAVQDRGLFDFMGKKKDEERKECHKEEEVLVTGVEKVQIEEGEQAEEEKKMGLLEKLHRSHSSSSNSSSDDEQEAEGENKVKKKKKKKKGLKEKIKEKHGCEEAAKKPEVEEDTAVVVEKTQEETVKVEATPPEQEKGLLEKIKEKLPDHRKPADEAPAPPSRAAACAGHGEEHEGDEGKEKKGILGRIMEKLPGYHKTEEKEGAKKSPK